LQSYHEKPVIRRVRERNIISLPIDFLHRFNIENGDYIAIEKDYDTGKMILKPVILK